MIRRLLTTALLVLAMLAVGPGCKATMSLIGSAGQMAGVFTPEQAESMERVGEKADKAREEFTPSHEHYIGRSVAATLSTQYKPFDRDAANHYLNVLGSALAMASDMPETFTGYHFLILDSDEINAFGMPGGFIFVTRGLLRCCGTEDELAAVLAHEVGHVSLRHGVNSIRKGRMTGLWVSIAAEGAKSFVDGVPDEVVAAFEGCVDDIVKDLVVNGYSRQSELAADLAAVQVMKRIGYDPRALTSMLTKMQERRAGDTTRGFGKTHPSEADRISNIARQLGPVSTADTTARQARFDEAMTGI